MCSARSTTSIISVLVTPASGLPGPVPARIEAELGGADQDLGLNIGGEVYVQRVQAGASSLICRKSSVFPRSLPARGSGPGAGAGWRRSHRHRRCSRRSAGVHYMPNTCSRYWYRLTATTSLHKGLVVGVGRVDLHGTRRKPFLTEAPRPAAPARVRPSCARTRGLPPDSRAHRLAGGAEATSQPPDHRAREDGPGVPVAPSRPVTLMRIVF